MPKQWGKKVRLFDLSGRSSYVTKSKSQAMLATGDAELLYETPLTIRLVDKVGYKDELLQQTGRVVKVSKCPTLDQRDIKPATARKNTRCKLPRHTARQVERDFQRYKTGWLRRRGEEEAERADKRMRAGARALSKVS